MLNKIIRKIAIIRYNSNYMIAYSIFNNKLSKEFNRKLKARDLAPGTSEYEGACNILLDWVEKLNVNI